MRLDPRLQLSPWPWDKGQDSAPRLPWWDTAALALREQDVLDRDDPWLAAWIAAYEEAGRWTR